MTDYDPDNIFGKILRGEMPCHRAFEDEAILVMMDVFPQSRGHTLIIPKTPSRNILDADPDALAKVARYLPRVARAVRTATKADGLRLMQFNEAPSGQTVFHLHFHLVPIYVDVALAHHAAGARADDAELAALAEAIGAQLAA